MGRTRAITFIFSTVLVAGSMLPAEAREFKKLKGDYIFTTNAAAKSKEFGLIISGQAAKELYAAMPFKAKPDICTGGTRKDAPNGLFCIKESKEFTCSMGIVVKTRKVTAGPLTC